MNIFKPKPQGVPRSASPITKEALLDIIEQVEQDPCAGLGSLSKKEILVDRLLAHIRITSPPQQIEHKPLLSEPLLLTEQAVGQ